MGRKVEAVYIRVLKTNGRKEGYLCSPTVLPVDKLAERNFADMTPELRANTIEFYNTTNVPAFAKAHPDRWNRVLHNIAVLKAKAPEATASHMQETSPWNDDCCPRSIPSSE